METDIVRNPPRKAQYGKRDGKTGQIYFPRKIADRTLEIITVFEKRAKYFFEFKYSDPLFPGGA